jgi:solute carrier family 35 protein C2
VTSGDVGLSNLSLVRITITFYTMVKASTPIFVLIWAYLFGIERITPQLLIVVFIIAVGEYFTVKGEVDFDRIGFFLCLSASMLSGARWTLVQLKLRSLDPPLKTTIATMKVLSPSMFVSLFIFSLCIERPWIALSHKSMEQTLATVGLGLLGANLAIAMILCEFYLIMRANAIVLMIGGVIKEMVSIFIGVTYFDDSLNGTNVTGCFIVFLGVLFYKVIHYIESQHETQNEMLRVATSDIDNSEGDTDESDHSLIINTEMKSSQSLSRSPYNGSKKKYEKLLSSSSVTDDLERYDKVETQSDGLLRMNNSSLHGKNGGGSTSRRHDGIELRRNKSGEHSLPKQVGSNCTVSIDINKNER